MGASQSSYYSNLRYPVLFRPLRGGVEDEGLGLVVPFRNGVHIHAAIVCLKC